MPQPASAAGVSDLRALQSRLPGVCPSGRGTGCKPVGSAYGGLDPPAPILPFRLTRRVRGVEEPPVVIWVRIQARGARRRLAARPVLAPRGRPPSGCRLSSPSRSSSGSSSASCGRPSSRSRGRLPQDVDREELGYGGDDAELVLVRDEEGEVWVTYRGESEEELEALIAEAREREEPGIVVPAGRSRVCCRGWR